MRSLLMIMSLAACGVSQDDATGTSATGVTASAWETSLPAGTSDVTIVKTISVRGCEFAVGTATLAPPPPDSGIPAPPVFLAFVERGVREHGPKWCTPGFVVYGASAGPSVQVDVAVRPGKPFLVLDYTFQVVQGGHSQLGIVELDAATGETLCRTTLSSPDDIASGDLSLDAHGTLTVTGETGIGTPYVTVYPDFLSHCPSSD